MDHPEGASEGQEGRAPKGSRYPAVQGGSAALDAVPEDGHYLFPGGKEGAGLSNAAMSELLKGMGYSPDYATVHGFRSTFKDWCSDITLRFATKTLTEPSRRT